MSSESLQTAGCAWRCRILSGREQFPPRRPSWRQEVSIMKLYYFAFSPNCRKGRAAAEVDRWMAWQLAHLQPAMSKVAFERIVKKLTGQGPPNQALIEAGTVEFAAMTAVLEGELAGKDYVAGALSIADFSCARW